MATLVKTPAGRWKAVVRRRGAPTVCKTWRTKRDAADWARSVEDELRRGTFVRRDAAERLTLAAGLDRYLREVTPTKSVTTASREINRAGILKRHLGAYALASLTPERIAAFRDEAREAGKSAGTVRTYLALLSHLFEIAIKEWRVGLSANPVRAVRPPPIPPGRGRRLSADEERRLLAGADAHSNPMLGWMVRLALATGMRAGEIRRLRRRDVDLQRRVAVLRDTKNHETRGVPLLPPAVTVLRAAMAHPIRPLNCDLLFFGEPGRDGVRRGFVYGAEFHRLQRGLDLVGLRFHDLRHEAISRFVEMGLSDQEVAAISGHKSMQMLRRYTHLRAEDLVTRLDAVSGAPPKASG